MYKWNGEWVIEKLIRGSMEDGDGLFGYIREGEAVVHKDIIWRGNLIERGGFEELSIYIYIINKIIIGGYIEI